MFCIIDKVHFLSYVDRSSDIKSRIHSIKSEWAQLETITVVAKFPISMLYWNTQKENKLKNLQKVPDGT